jgi:hypothetical protein
MKAVVAISPHARAQATRRGLLEQTILDVAGSPEQRIAVRPGREVCQSRLEEHETGKTYLVRVVVDVTAEGRTVVTAYRTSRIEKYWRQL